MTKDLQQRFYELVNGKEDTRYPVILDALRKSLKSIPKLRNLKYGCIAFYNYNVANKGMYMKVFPFDPSVIDCNFPDDTSLQISLLERINKERYYGELHHLTHFQKNFSDYGHFHLTIQNDSKTLLHSKDKIDSREWTEVIADFETSDAIEANRFDLLFFKSGQKSFATIPLPVLSSPAILLILPHDDYGGYLQIIEKTKEPVDFYLYNRLIKELGRDFDLTDKELSNELMFVKRFMIELSQVIVPIKYKIINQSNGKVELMQPYFNWFEEEHSCLSILELKNLAGYKVEMTLATFCINGDGVLINQKEPATDYMYGAKEEQVVTTLENIFELVYKYWKTRRDVEDKILQGLKARIKKSSFNEKNIEQAMEVMKKLMEEVKEIDKLNLNSLAEYLTDSAPQKNSFIKTDLNYQIIYNGITVTVPSSHKGFECLFYAMKKGTDELSAGKKVETISWEHLPVKDEIERTLNENAAKKTNGKKEVTLSLRQVIEIAENIKKDFESLLTGLSSSVQNITKQIADSNTAEFKKLLQQMEWSTMKDFAGMNALIKKCLDELKQCEIVKQEQAEAASKMKSSQFAFVVPLSIKTNFIHKGFIESYDDYSSAYKETESDDVNKLRSIKGKSVPDSKIRDEMAKAIDRAFESFIFKNIREPDLSFLKKHFEYAGIYKPKSNGSRDTSHWKYDQSGFAINEKIEWSFDDRTIA